MKVICIDNTAKTHPNCIGSFMVKEGGIYEVAGGFEQDTEYFYFLKEDIGGNGWNSVYFIPLSNIEEKIINYATERI